jgi:DNA-binding transcriptional LysR family regulator
MSIDRVLRSYLKLRHLQLLQVLDEVRNLRKAASLLGITQPAASKALAEIESAFGLALFHRSVAGTHPTAYGEIVVRFARTVLAEFDRTRDDLTNVVGGRAGRVMVAAMSVATGVLLPRSVALLKARSPRTTVLVEDGFLDTLLPRLRAGEFDMVISRLEPRWTTADLEAEPLYQDSLTVVASPHHPLVGVRKPGWRQLSTVPWIVPRAGAPIRLRLERTFSEQGLSMPRDVVEVTSLMSIAMMLRERPAVALLSDCVARDLAGMGVVRVLPVALPFDLAPVGLIRVRGKPVSPAGRLLIDCLHSAAEGVKRGERRGRTALG